MDKRLIQHNCQQIKNTEWNLKKFNETNINLNKLSRYQNSEMRWCLNVIALSNSYMYIRSLQFYHGLESFVFQDCFYIKLLIITFIGMFGIQYWKCNNICNTWKRKKEKLKILMWYTYKTYQWVFLMHLKYIKLVILKILFILGLCNFKFCFKILRLPYLPPPRPPPPKKKNLSWTPALPRPPPPPKIKISDPQWGSSSLYVTALPG